MKNKAPYTLNAWLAIFFAIALMTGETIRRFGEWGHWSRWMDDYFLGLALIVPATPDNPPAPVE